MRKYQQLFLVTISVLSIVTLLLYRSENGRLKYVLDVVNFFGQQTDRLSDTNEPSFEFTTPFPIWQRIGKGFHAYAAFWHADRSGNNGGSGAGEVITIVAGLQHAIVSFRCDVTSGGGISHPGHFGFNREELPVELPTVAKESRSGDEYIVYKFICRFKELTAPQRITFTDLTTKQSHSIGVRDFATAKGTEHRATNNTRTTTASSTSSSNGRQRLVACVNLVSPLTTGPQRYFNNNDDTADNHLLEYFFHHQVIGVDEFIVYDNRDRITLQIKRRLAQHSVRVSYLPFNFPFAVANGADDPKLRHILQLDCELRTLNISHWFIVAQPNEVLYVDEFLYAANSTLTSLLGLHQPQHHRFEVATNTVCLNASMAAGSIDENLYIATAEDVVQLPGSSLSSAAFPLRRPQLQSTTSMTTGGHANDEQPQRLAAVRLLVNRYVECRPMDRNTEVTHNTWPTTIEPSAARKLLHFGGMVRTEVLKMLAKPLI